jgi:O-antigen/teichoic acid export membrane protein
VVATGFGVALTITLVRTMSRTQYGTFAAAQAAVALVGVVAGLGLTQGVTQVAASRPGREAPVVRTSLRLATWSSAAMIIVLLGLAIALATGVGRGATLPAVAALMPVAALSPFVGAMNGLTRVAHLPRVLAGYMAAGAVLSFTLATAAVILGFRSAVAIAGLRSAAAVLAVVILVVPTARWLRTHRSGGQAPAGQLLRAGLVVTMSGALAASISQLDVLILSIHSGVDATGLYQPASRINDVIIGLAPAVGAFFLAGASRLIAAGRHQEVGHLYHRTARWVLALCAPALGVAFVAPGPLLHLAFGPSAVGAATALRILTAGAMVQIASGFNGMTLWSFGRLRLVAVLVVVTFVADVLLCLVLIPQYGINGAALATSGAFVVSNVLGSAVLWSVFGVPLGDRPLGITVGVFLAATALALGLSVALGLSSWADLAVALAVVGSATGVSSYLVSSAAERREVLRLPSALWQRPVSN